MMYSALALITLTFSFCPAISSQEREIHLDPKTVSSEEGDFVFSDLVLKTSAPAMLSGKITNNTTRDWRGLSFDIDGLDNAGNLIDRTIKNDIFISSLRKGATEVFSDEMLVGFLFKPLARVGIKFGRGDYQVDYVFSMIKPISSASLDYKDAFIEIAFVATSQQLSFVLKNKTTNSITVDWNQLSYIDSDGGSHKVIHEGVKYMSKSDVQAATVIPPTAKLTDIIAPSDYISYQDAHWIEQPLFPQGKMAGKYKGATFSAFMPLLISGRIKNYLFTFKITDVR